MKSIYIIGSIVIFLTGCAISENKNEFYQINSKEYLDKILSNKENINLKDFPTLPYEAWKTLNKVFPIKIVENVSLNDAAQAARVFSSDDYTNTQGCVVFINPYFSLKNEESNFSVSKRNNTGLEHIDSNKMKEFIYLHELAHCMDNKAAPINIKSYEWREAFADGYAASIMLSSGEMNLNDVKIIMSARNKTENIGAFKMLNELIKNIDSLPIKLNQSINFENELSQIKKIRKNIFILN